MTTIPDQDEELHIDVEEAMRWHDSFMDRMVVEGVVIPDWREYPGQNKERMMFEILVRMETLPYYLRVPVFHRLVLQESWEQMEAIGIKSPKQNYYEAIHRIKESKMSDEQNAPKQPKFSGYMYRIEPAGEKGSDLWKLVVAHIKNGNIIKEWKGPADARICLEASLSEVVAKVIDSKEFKPHYILAQEDKK